MTHTLVCRASKFIGAVACCLAIAAPGHSQEAGRLQCPAGYWLYGALCLRDATGDVVYASAAKAPRVEANSGCRSGYWRYGALCLSSATGDVEMAEEATRSASGQRQSASQQ